MTNAVQTVEQEGDVIPAGQSSPQALVQYAIDKGAGIEQLQQLMELQERWEANEARKAYNAAMATFKADPPRIKKNKRVSFQTSKGKTEYDHATLDHIAEQVSRAMAHHGLRFSWSTDQLDSGVVRVTCTVSHEAGHSESVTLSGAPDQSGQKNSIQQVGSTITYLQRYTLLAATGLAAEDQDNDGRGAEGEPISETQAKEIHAWLKRIQASEEETVLLTRWLGAETVEAIPANRYQKAINALRKKAEQREAKQ